MRCKSLDIRRVFTLRSILFQDFAHPLSPDPRLPLTVFSHLPVILKLVLPYRVENRGSPCIKEQDKGIKARYCSRNISEDSNKGSEEGKLNLETYHGIKTFPSHNATKVVLFFLQRRQRLL